MAEHSDLQISIASHIIRDVLEYGQLSRTCSERDLERSLPKKLPEAINRPLGEHVDSQGGT